MGLLDGLFGFIGQQGATATGNVTSSQPQTASGGNYTSTPGTSLPGSPAPQPQQINPISWVQQGIGGIGNTITGGIQYGQTIVAGGIQAIQPVTQPIVNTINQGAMYINPVTAPIMIGAGAGMFASSIIPQQPAPMQSPSSGAVYTNTTIGTSPGGMTMYVPFGNRAQTEVNNVTTLLYDRTGGGFEAMVVPYGHSITNIVSSGSSGSLQSGMFSTKPLTPIVYTQASAGTALAPSAMPTEAAQVMANPTGFSRLGAEAYGGYVMPLDNRVLSPDAMVSTYPAGSGNLAALVNPVGINMTKDNFAVLPWNVSPSMTGIYAVDTKGKFTALDASGYQSIGMVPPGGRLIGGKVIAGGGTIVEGAMPTPENQWVYRNDPLTILAEGALYAGDSLTFGLWNPGKELLVQKGQSTPSREYGAFSEWSYGVGSGIQRTLGVETPLTKEDFTRIEQSPAFNALPIQTQWAEGVYKVLATDPASLGRSALQGVEIYATMGVAELGFGAMAARATPGVIQTAGKGGIWAMGSPYVQGAIGTAFIGAGVWESTQGFSLPRGQAVSNLGGMSIHLAAMTGGAIGAGGLARVSEIKLDYGTRVKTPAFSNDAATMSFGGVKPKEPTIIPKDVSVGKPTTGYSIEQMKMAYSMKGTTVPVPRAYLQPEAEGALYGYKTGGNVAGGAIPKGYPNIETFVPASSVSKMTSSRTPGFHIFGVEKTYGVANSENLAAYGRGKLSPVTLEGGGTIFKLPTEKAGAPARLTKTGRFWMDVEKEVSGGSGGGSGGVVGNVGSRGGIVVDTSTGRLVMKGQQQEQSFAVSGGIFETGKDYSKLMTFEHLAPDYARKTRIFEEEAEYTRGYEIPGVKRPEPPSTYAEKPIYVLPTRITNPEQLQEQSRIVGISPASRAAVLQSNWQRTIPQSAVNQERIAEKISGVGLASISILGVSQTPLSLQTPVSSILQQQRQSPMQKQLPTQRQMPLSDVIQQPYQTPVQSPQVTPITTPVQTPILTPVQTPEITTRQPPEIIPEIPIPLPGLPGFMLGGGSGSDYGYRGAKSWASKNPVGADFMKASRGSLPNFKKMKGIKFKGPKLPKF